MSHPSNICSKDNPGSFMHYGEVITRRNCFCGEEMVFKTHWGEDDPGRRYFKCRRNGETSCGERKWHDPPMCLRARRIIPGLLRKLNKYEHESPSSASQGSCEQESIMNYRELVNNHKKVQSDLKYALKKSEMKVRVMRVLVAILILLCIAITIANKRCK